MPSNPEGPRPPFWRRPRIQLLIAAVLGTAFGVTGGIQWGVNHGIGLGRQYVFRGDDRGDDPGASARALCETPHRAICGLSEALFDPTGPVFSDRQGEQWTEALSQRLQSENPNLTPQQLNASLIRKIYTQDRVAPVENAFRWTRSQIEELIQSQPSSIFSNSEKRFLLTRIRETALELPPTLKSTEEDPDLLLQSGVYFVSPLTSGKPKATIRVGGAYLLSTGSRYNLIFTLAHELGHAIDPCEIRRLGRAIPAYDRLAGCFLRQELVAARTTRSECGKNDQLSEVFADWLAVQVLSRSLETYAEGYSELEKVAALSNSVRDLCEENPEPDTIRGEDPAEESSSLPDLTHHPSPEIRIQKILTDHPKIRKQLGCAEPKKNPLPYCEWTP